MSDLTEINSKFLDLFLNFTREGDSDTKSIRDFVDNYLLARDSRALREYIRDIQPDIDLNIFIELNGESVEIEVPIGVNFFFPDI